MRYEIGNELLGSPGFTLGLPGLGLQRLSAPLGNAAAHGMMIDQGLAIGLADDAARLHYGIEYRDGPSILGAGHLSVHPGRLFRKHRRQVKRLDQDFRPGLYNLVLNFP